MTPAAPPRTAPGRDIEPVQVITRRLAAAGFGVQASHWQDKCELIIVNLAAARSCLTLTGSGTVQWHYEPAPGTAADPATLTAIITHILSAPRAADTAPGADACRAFPLKGAVGRYLHDRGLTVTLHVSEDLESFEATTDIEVTSPARPWLGLVRLADDATIEWDCDWRAAFHPDPATLIDTITPILR